MPDTQTTRDPVVKCLAAWRTATEAMNGLATERTPISTAVPRLLDALEAVLATHRPTSGGDGKDRCCWCREYYGERSPWPCGEYLTIKAKLLGQETAPAGDG